MASLITTEFEQYIAQQTVNKSAVIVDEFIFANIPGLTDNNLKNNLKIPTNSQIVHRQAISQSGYINENAIVYSVTMGTEIGDFDFNFVGLINKSKNLLAVAVYTDTIKKIKNKNGVQGNSITRSVLLKFTGAKTLTGINVNANTWQIDFTARLQGIDEKIRLTNRDLYGRAVFFNDSFLVKRLSGNRFTIEQGNAYIEGVRAELPTKQTITASNLPCSIYVDIVHHCTVTGRYETEIKFLQQSKNDYVDSAGYQHYVQIIADIDSNAKVTDRRLLSPFLGITPKKITSNTKNQKEETGHTHEIDKASTTTAGVVQLSSETNSESEKEAATPKAVKEAYDKGVEGLNKANSADDNANSRVLRAGDTMTGDLTVNATVTARNLVIQPTNDEWVNAKFNIKNGGMWQLEFNPKSEQDTRLNIFYKMLNNDTRYISFPSISKNETVAYQSWVENLTKITGNLKENGWCKLPNGLILQWGKFKIGRTTNEQKGTCVFPIAFPSSVFSVVVGSVAGRIAAQSQEGFAVNSQSLTSFDWISHWDSRTGIYVEQYIQWLSIGI